MWDRMEGGGENRGGGEAEYAEVESSHDCEDEQMSSN